MLKALKYCHSGGLVHRDLKPSNLLLNEECLLKVADFGLARSLRALNESEGSASVLTDYVATRWYRAPEIILGSNSYTYAVDMWAVGCIIAEMFIGKPMIPGSRRGARPCKLAAAALLPVSSCSLFLIPSLTQLPPRPPRARSLGTERDMRLRLPVRPRRLHIGDLAATRVIGRERTHP
eukprot:2661802-Pleurochrysis_carterae.AAC.2